MKKLVFAATAALVMASFITSCTTESGKCFHVRYTVPAQEVQIDKNGDTTRQAQAEYTQDGYKWMTTNEKSACETEWKKLNYKDITIEEAPNYKTKGACLKDK